MSEVSSEDKAKQAEFKAPTFEKKTSSKEVQLLDSKYFQAMNRLYQLQNKVGKESIPQAILDNKDLKAVVDEVLADARYNPEGKKIEDVDFSLVDDKKTNKLGVLGKNKQARTSWNKDNPFYRAWVKDAKDIMPEAGEDIEDVLPDISDVGPVEPIISEDDKQTVAEADSAKIIDIRSRINDFTKSEKAFFNSEHDEIAPASTAEELAQAKKILGSDQDDGTYRSGQSITPGGSTKTWLEKGLLAIGAKKLGEAIARSNKKENPIAEKPKTDDKIDKLAA